MHYVTVFDASVHPYRNLTFVLPGVGFMIVGVLMVFRPTWLEVVFRRPFRHRFIFGWFFLLFSVFWTVTASIGLIKDVSSAAESAQPGHCETVEGRVERFHPMPFTGHDMEHFEVQGVEFNYSDYIVSAGFNNTSSHGGPIREGLPVRICHRDGEILKLEIAK